jgi:predicted kinase
MCSDKPKLYLLCGLSFAGKSTLARRLAAPLNAVIVEADDYIAVVRPNTLSKLDEWRAIQKLARGKAQELLEAGMNVIFDDLMVDPRDRVEMEQLAQQCGAKFCTIFLNTSPELVRWRQQQQSPTPEQQAIYDQHTELLLSQLIPPPREQAVYVQPDDDFNAVLEKIRQRWHQARKG